MSIRRLVFTAVFVVAVAVSAVSTATAQGRGMGRSMGSAGSHGFAHGGSRGGSPARIGFSPRTDFNTFRPSGFGFGVTTFGFRGRNHFARVRFGDRFFFRDSRFISPWAFGGFPYYAYPIDPYYNSYEPPVYAQPVYDPQQQQFDADVQDLRDEVRTLREENYAAQRPAPYSTVKPQAANDGPPTILIFRDGHKVETSNYAITGQTLWIFNERRATKVPVSDLDVNATKLANEPHGVEFSLPRSN
jgi:hypothetical protein